MAARRNQLLKLAGKETSKKTDLSKIWTRPLDLNNFNIIFNYQYRNEYDNSFRFVQTNDLFELKQNLGICTTTQNLDSLYCHEELCLSESEAVDSKNLDMFNNSDDSCEDRDYIPDSYESSSDNEHVEIKECKHQVKKRKHKITEFEQSIITTEVPIFDKPMNENVILTQNENFSEFLSNIQPIRDYNLSTEEMCSKKLTQNDNNVIEMTSEQSTQQEQNTTEEILSDQQNNCTTLASNNITHQEYSITKELTSEQIVVADTVTNKGYTRSGKPRQRRKFEVSKKERQAIKIQEKRQKLSIKTPCSETCKKKCNIIFNQEEREQIHYTYINMSYEEQGLFIKCMVDQKEVSRRLLTSNMHRKCTYVYHLKVNNERLEVCKSYFLTTLGYDAKNDAKIRSVLKKPIDEQKCNRGTYQRLNKMDKDSIKNHIKSYNPCISHYRREHAPNRLYLPSDITVTLMHKQFLIKYPQFNISFELYRTVVKDLNISFVRLGHEECEQCALFYNHNPNHGDGNLDETCDECISYSAHKLKYTETRIEYKKDADLAGHNTNDVFFSVDLQKIIMLPRIEQYKSAIFCPRIIAFNESFVPLGSQTGAGVHVAFAAIWNETITGRNQEDIISTFRAFLINKRDVETLTIWLDNCAAQNKNWALLSFLVEIVNSNLIATKTITLKYFEPGHTFMSADSFHHQVEQALRKMGKVFDFSDFVECVRATNSKNYVKIMEISDFFNYQDHASQHKLKKNEPRVYLKDLMAVRFEKGLYKLKYKRSHSDDEFQDLDFLQAKVVKLREFPAVAAKIQPRGINEERKKNIISKLVPLMPENRKDFWYNLHVSDAKDLTQND